MGTHPQTGGTSISKKRKSHLRGERGQAFADLIRGIPSEQILCVSLDIRKYFHVVMMHNGLGEIVRPTFEIDFYRSGFEQLCQALDLSFVFIGGLGMFLVSFVCGFAYDIEVQDRI